MARNDLAYLEAFRGDSSQLLFLWTPPVSKFSEQEPFSCEVETFTGVTKMVLRTRLPERGANMRKGREFDLSDRPREPTSVQVRVSPIPSHWLEGFAHG